MMNKLTSSCVIRRVGIFWLLLTVILSMGLPYHLAVSADGGQRQSVESNDSRVQQVGTWQFQATQQASGGGYLYNLAGKNTALVLEFAGPFIEIGYVSGPTLGVMAVEVDGVVLRTVFTTDSQTRYQQKTIINYLTDEQHTLRVYAQSGGVIAVDAFAAKTIGSIPVVAAPVERTTITTRNCLPDYALTYVSNAADGTPLPNAGQPQLSSDGRYVAFQDGAPTVLDTHLKVVDRQTCTVMSVPSPLEPLPNARDDIYSVNWSLSPDGRYLAMLYGWGTTVDTIPHVPPLFFQTKALFLHDRLTATTTQFTAGNAFYVPEDIDFSADGRYLASTVFPRSDPSTMNANLALLDLTTMQWSGLVIPLYVSDYYYPTMAVSANAAFIAFVVGEVSVIPPMQLYVFNRQTQQNELVTQTPTGDPSTGHVGRFDISADGRIVAFESEAADLVAGSPTGGKLYLYDRQTDQFEYILHPEIALADLSDNGRVVAYVDWQDALPGDTNGYSDVVVYDRQTHTHTLLSHASDSTPSNGRSGDGDLTADGRLIAFTSHASNLLPTGQRGVFTVPTGVYLPLTGDGLTVFRPDLNAVSLINSLQDVPPPTAYTSYTTNAPVTGQWVMGDWDGDGNKTMGVYDQAGVFYYTNSNSPSATWSAIWIGLLGRPAVVGHFNGAVNHDCMGAVDSAEFPPYGTAFALYFACDLTNGTAPPLTFQWLSVVLPSNQGFTGTHQFAAGDFDNDGVASIAVRRGVHIAYTNIPPTTLLSQFNLAQYWGVPPVTGGDEGQLVAGDFDHAAGDSFGVVYQNGHFYYRNTVDWNPGGYTLQRVGQPIGAPFTAATWH